MHRCAHKAASKSLSYIISVPFGHSGNSVHNFRDRIFMWKVYMWKVVFLTALLAFTGTSPAAEYCKLKQYSDGELVARESVLVIDRGDSFSVRTSQTVFNSPLLKYGYAVDRQGVEYRHGTMESGKLWITLPWLKISLHIDCN